MRLVDDPRLRHWLEEWIPAEQIDACLSEMPDIARIAVEAGRVDVCGTCGGSGERGAVHADNAGPGPFGVRPIPCPDCGSKGWTRKDET